MWRSSWSGPCGYDTSHDTGASASGFIGYGWSTDRNGGSTCIYPAT